MRVCAWAQEMPLFNDTGMMEWAVTASKTEIMGNEAMENCFSLFPTLSFSVSVSLTMWAGSQR